MSKNNVKQVLAKPKIIEITEKKEDPSLHSNLTRSSEAKVEGKNSYFYKKIEQMEDHTFHYYYSPSRFSTSPVTEENLENQTKQTSEETLGKVEDKTYHHYYHPWQSNTDQVTLVKQENQKNMEHKQSNRNIKLLEVKPMPFVTLEKAANQSPLSDFHEPSEKIEDQTYHYYYSPQGPSTSQSMSEIIEDHSHGSISLTKTETRENQTNLYYYSPLKSFASQEMLKTMDGQTSKRTVEDHDSHGSISPITTETLENQTNLYYYSPLKSFASQGKVKTAAGKTPKRTIKLIEVKPMKRATSEEVLNQTYHYYYSPLINSSFLRTVKNSTIIFSTLMLFIATSIGVIFIFICE